MSQPLPLSVCLVSQEFPPHTNWGGVGVQFAILARGLAERGHRVTVISRASPGAPARETMAPGSDVWRVGVPITRKRLLGRTLDRILHARAAAAKVRELDRVHRFDIVESAAASLDADAIAADPAYAPRTVICVHGSNFLGQPVGGLLGPLHNADWRWGGARELRMLDRAAQIVVSSNATDAFVRSQRVDERKIVFAALGVDTVRFHPPESRATGPLVVGFVGRLQPSKGIDFVWKVMEQIGPDAGIRFVFKGAIHPAARQEVADRMAQFRSFAEHHGPGPHDEMPGFYRSLDVLLLPSRFENFGLTYAEAMATGLLVFAGSGGAGPETVTDGVTGFVVDPDGEVDSTVARLRTLANDRSAFDGIRRAAREEVLARISIDQFISAKERQYRALGTAAAR